eukprot:5531341-Amphidinium_carterae.1
MSEAVLVMFASATPSTFECLGPFDVQTIPKVGFTHQVGGMESFGSQALAQGHLIHDVDVSAMDELASASFFPWAPGVV